ncbi:hypothetical protein glysoja_048395, partial [Glycine soja]
LSQFQSVWRISITFCFFSGPLQVTHWLSFVSGGIVLSLIILVVSISLLSFFFSNEL